MNALGRLLSVGSEWGGYATLVPTGGARKAARAAADEASEQLGRQGARQAARKTDDEWVHLYRAVSPGELEDVLKTRRVRALWWQEMKYFSLTLEGAAKYARMAGRQGKGSFTLIRVQVRRNLLRNFDILEVDRGIPAVVVPKGFLPLLGRPRVLPYMPLVP